MSYTQKEFPYKNYRYGEITLSKEKGNLGERIAIDYLKNKNLNFVCKNYYSKYGEIDIIFENSKYIIFVEVKLRKKNAIVSGLEAISYSKQKKIVRTAYSYIQNFGVTKQPRFDVISIAIDYKTQNRSITHIENAFMLEENINNEIF